MKIKGLALLGLIPALLLSSMATSFADSTPTPTPSSSASTDFQTLMDQYKLNIDKYRALQNLNSEPQSAALQFKAAMDMYRMLQDSRDELRSQINRNFMTSVDKANKEARAAIKLAKGASVKNDILAKQKIAVAAASDIRDAAIAALGALPTPPLKPIKVAEAMPTSKSKSKKSTPSPTSESDH